MDCGLNGQLGLLALQPVVMERFNKPETAVTLNHSTEGPIAPGMPWTQFRVALLFQIVQVFHITCIFEDWLFF